MSWGLLEILSYPIMYSGDAQPAGHPRPPKVLYMALEAGKKCKWMT